VAPGELKGPTVRFIIEFARGIDSPKNISQRSCDNNERKEKISYVRKAKMQ
jgi:hypothetical protein